MPATLPRSLTMPWDRIGRAVDVGSRIERAVGRAIAEDHLPLAFDPPDRLLIRDPVALAVRDRHADDLAGIVAAGERRIGALDLQMHVAADELQPALRISTPGSSPASAGSGSRCTRRARARPCSVRPHRIHDRRARRDRPAAQMLAVGQPPGTTTDRCPPASAPSACQTIAGSRPEMSFSARAMSRSRLIPGIRQRRISCRLIWGSGEPRCDSFRSRYSPAASPPHS